MKDLLIEIENGLFEKIEGNLTELKLEIKKLELGNKSAFFWQRKKIEREISSLIQDVHFLESFLEEEILFLSRIGSYYFLNLPMIENNTDVILKEKEYVARLNKKKNILDYLNMMKDIIHLDNAAFLAWVMSKNRIQNKEIVFDEKASLLTSYGNSSVEKDTDLSVKIYLASLLPELKLKHLEFQNLQEINCSSLEENWSYEKYNKNVQEYFIYHELNEMMSWKKYSKEEERITRETLLKAKQRIFVFFSKLKDYQVSFENEVLLQMENCLATSLIQITDELMNPSQISK